MTRFLGSLLLGSTAAFVAFLGAILTYPAEATDLPWEVLAVPGSIGLTFGVVYAIVDWSLDPKRSWMQ